MFGRLPVSRRSPWSTLFRGFLLLPIVLRELDWRAIFSGSGSKAGLARSSQPCQRRDYDACEPLVRNCAAITACKMSRYSLTVIGELQDLRFCSEALQAGIVCEWDLDNP